MFVLFFTSFSFLLSLSSMNTIFYCDLGLLVLATDCTIFALALSLFSNSLTLSPFSLPDVFFFYPIQTSVPFADRRKHQKLREPTSTACAELRKVFAFWNLICTSCLDTINVNSILLTLVICLLDVNLTKRVPLHHSHQYRQQMQLKFRF